MSHIILGITYLSSQLKNTDHAGVAKQLQTSEAATLDMSDMAWNLVLVIELTTRCQLVC